MKIIKNVLLLVAWLFLIASFTTYIGYLQGAIELKPLYIMSGYFFATTLLTFVTTKFLEDDDI